jgi:glyceraldehyde 3-phosphate dehydrogenase
MTTKVASGGFGRIGEMFFRASLAQPADFEVVAINDVITQEQIAYLLRYDSVHACPAVDFSAVAEGLQVGGRLVRVLSEKNPTDLPWSAMGVDVVVESTGVFEDRDGMARHIAAGARYVVLTAPAGKGGADVTVCMGVNDAALDLARHRLISNASCTTNCLAPVARALDESFGISWGLMSTVHAYTGTQSLIDAAQRGMRRGRAAAVNIVPTSTGAARAIALVLPQLEGKMDGLAFRVPVPDGSVLDLTFESARPFSKESLHAALRAAAADPSYRGVLDTTAEELVSSDILGSPKSAIVDETSTVVLDERRAKVVAWYDNEWGYACRVRDLVAEMAARLG